MSAAKDIADATTVAVRERRALFEKGKRHADDHVAVMRHELRRWRAETTFWKEEHAKLLKEFCDFTLEAEEIINGYVAELDKLKGKQA